MLLRESRNCLEIHKLELDSSETSRTCMQSVCSLELPPLRSDASIFQSIFVREWIASSEHHARSRSSQRRRLPFRSSRNDTLALRLCYHMPARVISDATFGCAMLFSVRTLISVVHSGVRKVSWENWGPRATRILPNRFGATPAPVGPFWITRFLPLTVCDYDPLRATHVQPAASQSGLPVFISTKAVSRHWVSGEVETSLPYREFVSTEMAIPHYAEIVGEREWIIVITETVCRFCTSKSHGIRA